MHATIDRSGRSTLGAVAIITLVAVVVAACAAPLKVDRDAAVEIARHSMIAGEPAGSVVADVNVLAADLSSDGGRAAWKINISAQVRPPGATQAYVSARWMFVDAESGTVRVFAQG